MSDAPMADQVRARLAELEREYQAGEQQLAELLRQEGGLRETMLRISGAMQVLRELAPDVTAAGPAADGGAVTTPDIEIDDVDGEAPNQDPVPGGTVLTAS